MIRSRIPKGWEIIKATVPSTLPEGKLKMCNDSNGDIYVHADEFGSSWYPAVATQCGLNYIAA
jgi:hypothetical protein